MKTPFAKMLFSGADFLNCNFTAGFFLFSDADLSKVKDDFVEVRAMWTRLQSIDIPRPKAQSFSVKTPLGTVEKVRSKFEGQLEATVQVRLDEDLQVFDFFNILSMNDERGDGVDKYCKVYAASSRSLQSSLIDRASRVDLAICHSNTMLPSDDWSSSVDWIDSRKAILRTLEGGASYANESLPENKSMCWVMEDVRFVGFQGGVEFKRASTGPQTLGMKMTFKRLARVVRS